MSSEDNAPLPPEAVNKIKLFLVAFNKLGIGISIREIWESPERGDLKGLVSLFQDNAEAYSIGDVMKRELEETYVFISVRIPRLGQLGADTSETEEELTKAYMRCKQLFKQLLPDYEARTMGHDISLLTQVSILRTQNTIRIVHEFYDVVDYLLDIKEATFILLQTYRSEELMKTLDGYYRSTTSELLKKFNTLIEDIKQYHPGVWNKIRDTHSRLEGEINRFCSYFNYNANTIMEDLKSILYKILDFMRTELRTLSKTALRNIIEESRMVALEY
jgi:hypothetical protein